AAIVEQGTLPSFDKFSSNYIKWTDEEAKDAFTAYTNYKNQVHKVTAPLFGWRVWKFNPTTGLIRSMSAQLDWEGPTMRVKDDGEKLLKVSGTNNMPGSLEDYGVYCYKSFT